jgi:hypothetical protein
MGGFAALTSSLRRPHTIIREISAGHLAALAASLGRKIMVLREAALFIGDACATLPASRRGECMIARKAAFLSGDSGAAFARDLTLLLFIHRSEAAVRGRIRHNILPRSGLCDCRNHRLPGERTSPKLVPKLTMLNLESVAIASLEKSNACSS